MMKYVRIFVGLLALVGAFVGLSVTTSPSAHAQTRSVSHSTPVKEVPTSETYLKQVALKMGGSSLVGHMKHRVTQTLGTSSTTRYGVATTTDNNWAGYVADASGLATPIVYGSQTCYNVSPASGGAVVATWAGVGGFHGTNLAQTGVDQSRLQSWYEFYPNYPVYLFAVAPGNEVCSYVIFDTSNGLWYVNTDDYSTGTYYAGEFAFNPDLSTADAITETQTNASVPNFSPVNFSQTKWADEYGTWRSFGYEDPTLWQVNAADPAGGAICSGYFGASSGGASFATYKC